MKYLLTYLLTNDLQINRYCEIRAALLLYR